MSHLAVRVSDRLARLWVALYTRGLPVDRRDARRAEITSDLWEHLHDDDVTASVLRRVLAGVPADLSWRVEEGRMARKGNAMHRMWFGRQLIIIPGIAVMAGFVTLAGFPSAVAALVAGLMVLALVGLTCGLVASPVGTVSATGAHMETWSIDGRRTTLLIVVAVSFIVLAGTYAYAMSLDHWGDTRAVIFIGLGWVSLAVGLVALVLLVADVVRARRR
jgi:hypothetical protein